MKISPFFYTPKVEHFHEITSKLSEYLGTTCKKMFSYNYTYMTLYIHVHEECVE